MIIFKENYTFSKKNKQERNSDFLINENQNEVFGILKEKNNNKKFFQKKIHLKKN